MLTRRNALDRQTPESASHRRKVLFIVIAAAAVLVVVLSIIVTGLVSNKSASPTEVKQSSPGAALPSGVPQAGAVPTKVPNDPALRQNVSVTDCSKTAKGWKAAGKATNPTDKPLDYTLTVFFTSDKATVLNTADTTVKVDPGKSANWTVQKDFPTTPKTLCVLRGVGTK